MAVSQGRSEKRDSLYIENWFQSSGPPRIGGSAEGALMGMVSVAKITSVNLIATS